jgi:uncharacterized integral membrane protein (TIGR00698 family)
MSQENKKDKPTRKPNALENLFFGCATQEVPKLIPGVCMIVALVALCIWSTNLINSALGFKGLISYILVVIVVGILLRNLATIPDIFMPGINYSVKKLLRLGIIMMGIRLSIFDVLKIGAWGIPIVVVCVMIGLVVTTYFGRLVKLPERLATLIAVGTGICGASAIVATAPGIEAKDEEVSYAIANITVFGIIALVAYPFIMHLVFGADTNMIGLFLGTSIHETAQVAASGMIYDQTFSPTAYPTALDVATVTKMVRNVMMAIVIPAMTFIYAKRTGTIQINHGSSFKKALNLFPVFILGFLLMAIFRSIGDAGIHGSGSAFGLWDNGGWVAIHQGIKQWSGYILATAMAGVGLSTSFKAMKGLGIRPFYVGLFAALMVGVAAIVMVFAFGRFVSI